MINNISAWGKNYLQNFREHPGKTTAALALQIVFLIGWGHFYYFLYKQYTLFVIPGIVPGKGNVYANVAFVVLITIVGIYISFRWAKMLFANDSPLRQKLLAVAGSVLCIPAALLLWIAISELPIFDGDIYTSFWAK